MNTRGLTRHPLSIALIAFAVFPLLLSACQPVNVATSLPPALPTATQPPADEPVALDTQTPAENPQPPLDESGDFAQDLSGVAQDQTVETIAAVPTSAGGPIWEVLPQHLRVTLHDYPVTNHLLQPQIFVYPVADLAVYNEAAGQMATDLQALLQDQPVVDRMPFLPLFNASQVMHAQVQYLDFKNGSGVRFLTQFDQGPMPINSYELIYTFQGLTSDGKYYVAAVLPITHPELPATQQVSPDLAAKINEFPTYLMETVTWLDEQPSSSFTPDLANLDAMIESIEVK